METFVLVPEKEYQKNSGTTLDTTINKTLQKQYGSTWQKAQALGNVVNRFLLKNQTPSSNPAIVSQSSSEPMAVDENPVDEKMETEDNSVTYAPQKPIASLKRTQAFLLTYQKPLSRYHTK